MTTISNNISNYIHTYEAYRIPKGTEIKNADGKTEITKEDQLVLTEESQKRLMKDRANYAADMIAERRKMDAEQNAEAEKKYAEDQAKMTAVFRSMSEGKTVSQTDEKKLMEYDPKLYMAAKMAQMMAQRVEEKKESHFNEQDEEEHKKKMKAYNAQKDEFNARFNSEFDKFVEAQKGSVVEIEMGNIDFSSLKPVVNLGGGISGTVIDTVV